MKTSLAIIALASLISFSASALEISPISNSDLDATMIHAEKIASKTAENFAADRSVEVVSIDKISKYNSLSVKYLVQTDTDCEFVVSVGLFFRSKVTSVKSCQ